MTGMTKAQYEAAVTPQTDSEETERDKGYIVCKKVYDWQEKSDWHTWTADLCEQETGVRVTPDYCLHGGLKRKDPHTPLSPVTAQFFRTEACAENEGICGKYKLMKMEFGTWRIEKV